MCWLTVHSVLLWTAFCGAGAHAPMVRSHPLQLPNVAVEISSTGTATDAAKAVRDNHADLAEQGEAADGGARQDMLSSAISIAKTWVLQDSMTWLPENSAKITHWLGLSFQAEPPWGTAAYWAKNRLNRMSSILSKVLPAQVLTTGGKFCRQGMLAYTSSAMAGTGEATDPYSCTVQLCQDFFQPAVSAEMRAFTLLHEILHCTGTGDRVYRKDLCLALSADVKPLNTNNYIFLLMDLRQVSQAVQDRMMLDQSGLRTVDCNKLQSTSPAATVCGKEADSSCKVALRYTTWSSCQAFCEARDLLCKRAEHNYGKRSCTSVDAVGSPYNCPVPGPEMLCWCAPVELAYYSFPTTTASPWR